MGRHFLTLMKKHPIIAIVFGSLILAGILVALGWGPFTRFFSRENRSMAAMQIGLSELSKRNLDEAIVHLEAAYTLDPKNVEAIYYLAKAYKQRGDPPKRQILAYQEILKIDPKSTQTHISLGAVYFEQGQKAEAEKEFMQALQLEPMNPGANNNMGRLRMEARRFKEAEAFFKKALEADPNNNFALNNLGNLYFVQSNYKESAEVFQRSLALEPRNPGPHYYLAQIAEKQKDKPKATEHWEKAIELGLQGEELKEAQERLKTLKK